MAARRSVYQSRLESYAARCPSLVGRDDELAALASFAAGAESYRWLVAPPWAGKTALVTYFAVHAPAGVDNVTYVVSRRDGENRLGQFRRAVCGQLAALVGDYAPAEPDTSDLFALWERAAAAVAQRGRALVLAVDGLDENDYQNLDEPSIASQLPPLVPHGAHVLITSRPMDTPPVDVDESHPLRTCRRVFMEASPAGGITRLAARQELDRVLAHFEQRLVLAAMTVAQGPLTARDIEDVAGVSRLRARGLLSGSLSRVVEQRRAAGGNSVPYALAHDTIAQAVLDDLDSDEVTAVKDAIDAWAGRFCARGWPQETPAYLVEGYPTLLAARQDGTRLAGLASRARHEMLRRRTGGIRAALTELSDAARLIAQQENADLTLLTRVASFRTEIEDATWWVPADYVIALAALGQVDEAVQAARSLQGTYGRSDALLGVARLLVGERPDEAARLALEGAQVPGRLSYSVIASVIEAAAVLLETGDAGAPGRALADVDAYLKSTSTGNPEYSVIDLLKPVTALDKQEARRLLDAGFHWSAPEERPHYLASVADSLAELGEIGRLYSSVSQAEPGDRLSLLTEACESLYDSGGPGAIPPELSRSLQAELSAARAQADEEQQIKDAASAAAYVSTEAALALLAGVRGKLPYAIEDGQLAQAIYRSMAAHGTDPRAVLVREDTDRDDALACAARAALLAGHHSLASSLASDIADPRDRAPELARVTLALTESGHKADAGPLMAATAAAINDAPGESRPRLLAALSEAAAQSGRPGIAESAGQAATTLAVTDHDPNSHSDYFIVEVLAAQGRLDDINRIAGSRRDELESAELLIRAAQAAAGHAALREMTTALLEQGMQLTAAAPDNGWRDRLEREADQVQRLLDHADSPPGTLKDISPGKAMTEQRALLAQARRREALELAEDAHGEKAAEAAVELADAGFYEAAGEVVDALLLNADPAATDRNGLWRHPWLALASDLTSRDEASARLREAAALTRFAVDIGSASHDGLPVALVVRLGLWEQYVRDTADMNSVSRDFLLADLSDEMLRKGLLTAALEVIENLEVEFKPQQLAKAADAAWHSDPRLCRNLVARSLQRGLTQEVIRPLTRLDARILDELADLLGASDQADSTAGMP